MWVFVCFVFPARTIDPFTFTVRERERWISATVFYTTVGGVRSVMFGSRVRGQFRPDSDTDIAVLLPGFGIEGINVC